MNVPKKGWESIPDGLGVRIPGFHPGGPGSIPGLGVFSFQQFCNRGVPLYFTYEWRFSNCITLSLYNYFTKYDYFWYMHDKTRDLIHGSFQNRFLLKT